LSQFDNNRRFKTLDEGECSDENNIGGELKITPYIQIKTRLF